MALQSRDLYAHDAPPLVHRGLTEFPELGRGHFVAGQMEQVGDQVVDRDEPLQMDLVARMSLRS